MRRVFIVASVVILASSPALAGAGGNASSPSGGSAGVPGVSYNIGSNGSSISGKTPAVAVSVGTGFGPATAAATSWESKSSPGSASTSANTLAVGVSSFGQGVAGALGTGPNATATNGY